MLPKIYYDEQGYLQLMRDILATSEVYPDRTGVGCKKVFGASLVFDLRESFPRTTVRNTPLRFAFEEWMFFMRGQTDTKILEDKGIFIWSGNTSREFLDGRGLDYLPEGSMGSAYGFQFRNFGGFNTERIQPKPKLPDGVEATFCGVANGENVTRPDIKSVWMGMIQRCYDKNATTYKYYGQKGVYVCNRWLIYKNFEEDVSSIPGWETKTNDPSRRFVLDKDYRGNGYLYSPETCCWITDRENKPRDWVTTVERVSDGKHFSFFDLQDFCKAQGISEANFYHLWTKPSNTRERSGFRLVSRVHRHSGKDQLTELFNNLRDNPFSRRHYVTFWNSLQSDEMALLPCFHSHQFYCEKENGGIVLHLKVFSRSSDVLFGLPFNTLQYALYLQMMSEALGYTAGTLLISMTDSHIYKNQFEYAQETVEREIDSETPRRVVFKRHLGNLDDILALQWEDVQDHNSNVNKKPYKTPKPPMAV